MANDDNNYQGGDPRVAQIVRATPDQIAAYDRAHPEPTSAVKVDSTGRPTTGTAPRQVMSATDPKGLGAKVLQSATFGFGADAAGALLGKRREQEIRQLEQDYDNQHPLASFGIDLAVAGATMPLFGAGEAKLAATGARLAGRAVPAAGDAVRAVSPLQGAARAVGGGAAYGAAQGAGSGGTMGERVSKAEKGAIVGGALGGVAAGITKGATPFLEKTGLVSPTPGALSALQAALKKDGKSLKDLNQFLAKNPGKRAADFSPSVAKVVSTAGAVSPKTNQALGDAIRGDAAGQADRIMGGVEATRLVQRSPAASLDKIKQEMSDHIDKLAADTKQTYGKAYGEIMPVSPELQKVLDHPEVNPILQQKLTDYHNTRLLGTGPQSKAPKYKVGAELPVSVLDDLQKAVGAAAKDEGVGTARAGVLQAAQRQLKEHQSGTIVNAQALAARLGGDEGRMSGIIGAQTWGSNFAFGRKAADPEAWERIKDSPEMVQYARLGMLDGLGKYLDEHTRMGDGALTKIADKLKTPQVTDVLGKKTANDVRKIFETEATRARTSASMDRSSVRPSDQDDGAETAIHAVKVAAGGPVRATLGAIKLLTGYGMSEKQALRLIEIAGQPGGMAKLQSMGATPKVMKAIDDAFQNRGKIAGRAGTQQDIKGSR
jgi:hypothetical protein